MKKLFTHETIRQYHYFSTFSNAHVAYVKLTVRSRSEVAAKHVTGRCIRCNRYAGTTASEPHEFSRIPRGTRYSALLSERLRAE